MQPEKELTKCKTNITFLIHNKDMNDFMDNKNAYDGSMAVSQLWEDQLYAFVLTGLICHLVFLILCPDTLRPSRAMEYLYRQIAHAQFP